MSGVDIDTSENILLRTMNEADKALLAPHLTRSSLRRGEPILSAHVPIDRICFPEGGIASILSTVPDGTRTEVGIFGREGMSGAAVVMGSESTPLDCFMQVEDGDGLWINIAPFRAALRDSTTLRPHLLLYCHAFMTQVAYTATSSAQLMIEGRLARWLLMCHDRIDGDHLAITHEFMAMMIAAQRTGVTIALHILEGAGMIHARRGRVTILDRDLLRDLAGDTYGTPEAEYRRLIGPFGRDPVTDAA